MQRRTLGDEIRDHFLGSQGVYTGSRAGQAGLDEHDRAKRRRGGIFPTSPHPDPKSAEENIAVLIGFGAAAVIFYAALTGLALAWYWCLGAAIVGGIGTAKLLLGPLYGLLVILKWLLFGAMLLLAAWLVAGL